MTGVRAAVTDRESAEQSTKLRQDRRTGESTPWLKRARSDDNENGKCKETFELLTETIEAQIIPRLLMVHKANAEDFPEKGKGSQRGITKEEMREFADLVMTQDTDVSTAFVETLYAQGVCAESVLLDLLAPTARHFGKLWEEDAADFMAVTLALSRLQQTLRRFAHMLGGEQEGQISENRVLLMTVPSEQHSFGLSVVGEFFRRAGWGVDDDPSRTMDEQLEVVSRENFTVVGLSLSCEVFIEKLVECLRAIRESSRNENVIVMVGGQLFLAEPDLVGAVGADATAADGKQAVEEAYKRLDAKSGRPT